MASAGIDDGKLAVTIVCVTYNHEKYISDALDSFLSQEADFRYQIFIADDCSTDDTREILRKYASEHPGDIRLFLPDQNRGAERNAIEMCKQAGTSYIALCDGDDYWTDERKLQMQYDYMEKHPEMRACFHDTEIEVTEGETWFLAEDYSNTEDGKMRWCTGHKHFNKLPYYTIADYIPCGFVHSSSMFIRWNYALEVPEWYYGHILGDYPLWCLQVGLGLFGYIDETMSVYRRHNGACYNFSSREEFWGATKPDWISIDSDLKGYFEALGAPEELLTIIDMRQKDDLGKLLKYAYRCRSASIRNAVLREYSELINRYSKTSSTIGGRVDGLRYIVCVDKEFHCSRPHRIRGRLRSIARGIYQCFVREGVIRSKMLADSALWRFLKMRSDPN